MLLSFSSGGELILTAPRLTPSWFIDAFLRKSHAWIGSHLGQSISRQEMISRRDFEYREKRKEAKAIIESRVKELAVQHGFHYRNIAIRNQRTRFGSCSRDGDLSFHYRIAFFAAEERDYVIFHELCHLRHFDHSPAFWEEVSRFSPDYRILRAKLR